jgi:hypothetical protein
MIIDCHCHAGKGDGLDSPWSTDAPIEPYLRRARAAGIDRTIIFAAKRSDYASANRDIAHIAAQHVGRVWCFACVHAQRDAGRIETMVEHAVERWGFRGIKVHRHEAPATREVARAARRFRLPILYDIMGQPSLIDLIASEYPDVNFIVPHLGSFADDWRVHMQVIDQLVRLPNVYADTSGVKRFDYLAEAVRRAGAHKLLFGSDGPWLHPALELHKIRLLGLPPKQEALVLGGNLLRLLQNVPITSRRMLVP